MTRDQSADGDAEAHPPTDSGLHRVARSFLTSLGGEEKADELDEQVNQLAPESVDARDMDALISAGLAVGASRAEIRRTMRERAESRRVDDGDDGDGDGDGGGSLAGPLVQGREIETADGGVAGVRIFVDDAPENVDVYRGDRSLLVRTPAGEHEEALGFDPARIEHDHGDGDVAEYVIRPPVDVDEGAGERDAGDTDAADDTGTDTETGA
jgi:hypothetical protein